MIRTTFECIVVLFGTVPFLSGAIFEYVRSGREADAAARGIARRPFRKRNREDSVL
jgi:hypothetical protein